MDFNHIEWTPLGVSTEINQQAIVHSLFSYRNANSLLKNMSFTFNKNIVNQKVKHLNNLCFSVFYYLNLCLLWKKYASVGKSNVLMEWTPEIDDYRNTPLEGIGLSPVHLLQITDLEAGFLLVRTWWNKKIIKIFVEDFYIW